MCLKCHGECGSYSSAHTDFLLLEQRDFLCFFGTTMFPISISSDPFTAKDSTIQVKDWSWHQCWWEQLKRQPIRQVTAFLHRWELTWRTLCWYGESIPEALVQKHASKPARPRSQREGTVFDRGSLLSTTLLQFIHLGIVLKQAVNDACAFCVDLDWHSKRPSAAKDRGLLLSFNSSAGWKLKKS